MKIPLLSLCLFIVSFANAQKIDSIYFHLYTDSLKKGVHNYINVDGMQSTGKWIPLSSKEIQFSASGGKFEGNDLVLPPDFADEKVIIKAILKNSPGTWKEIKVWIKKNPDNEILPTKNEVMDNRPARKRRHKNP